MFSSCVEGKHPMNVGEVNDLRRRKGGKEAREVKERK